MGFRPCRDGVAVGGARTGGNFGRCATCWYLRRSKLNWPDPARRRVDRLRWTPTWGRGFPSLEFVTQCFVVLGQFFVLFHQLLEIALQVLSHGSDRKSVV